MLPCAHLVIELTNDLDNYENLKLFLLNLGHSYLAERWLQDTRAKDERYGGQWPTMLWSGIWKRFGRDEALPVFASVERLGLNLPQRGLRAALATIKQ